jgi:hypothetical protein
MSRCCRGHAPRPVGLELRASSDTGPPRCIYGVSGARVTSCLKLSFRHFNLTKLLGVVSGVYHRKQHPIIIRARYASTPELNSGARRSTVIDAPALDMKVALVLLMDTPTKGLEASKYTTHTRFLCWSSMGQFPLTPRCRFPSASGIDPAIRIQVPGRPPRPAPEETLWSAPRSRSGPAASRRATDPQNHHEPPNGYAATAHGLSKGCPRRKQTRQRLAVGVRIRDHGAVREPPVQIRPAPASAAP